MEYSVVEEILQSFPQVKVLIQQIQKYKSCIQDFTYVFIVRVHIVKNGCENTKL